MPNTSLTSLLHVARAGVMAHQGNIDVIANNIANINTVGYKHSRAEFHELLNTALEAPPEGSNRTSGQAAGLWLVDNQRLFGQGIIQKSERPWDMAIEGDGFFQVQLADGTLAYTRNGSFQLDGEGNLINANGSFLAPIIALPPDAAETFIQPNGDVLARRRGEAEPEVVGTITLARFTNPAGLDNIGENLYQPSDASGEPLVGQADSAGFGQIIGQALEASNVSLSEEVVQLISAQRAYTLMIRALQTADQMMDLANQLR